MRFQVPQFIEVEDKIIGPFTIKQFIYLAGGAGLSFVLFKALPFFIAIFFIAPVAIFSLALAFYKINNQPFISVLESMVKYATKKKLYVWEKKPSKKTGGLKKQEVDTPGPLIPKVSEGKLKDIAWSLGVQESIYADQDKSGSISSENKTDLKEGNGV